MKIKSISVINSIFLFILPSAAFVVITHVLIPYLNSELIIHPALSWFIGGLLIFVSLFILAVYLTRKDGFRSKKELMERLRLKKLSGRDWKYVIFSTLSIFLLMGMIMGISRFLFVKYGIHELETTPSFMKFEVLTGKQRFLLFVWLIMFFFNMFGEELLWRGYILPRQEIKLKGKAWLLNSLLWLVFHACFGIDLIILLLPILFILPYAVYKTQNTYVGILIHTVLNGPMFILVSLGIM